MVKIDLLLFVQKLPQNVRDHFFDEHLAEMYGKKRKEFNLSTEQSQKLTDLVWQIYLKEVALPNFISEIEKRLGLNKEIAKKLGVEVTGWDFLPVADFLGVDVAGYLREIGADPHIFVQYANSQEVARELVEQIIAQGVLSTRGTQGASSVDTSPERLQRRLEDIILNRLNNVRDDLETKNVLTRGIKLGGLELDEAKAMAVLELIKVELESLASKRIILKEEKQAIVEAKPSPTSLPLEKGEDRGGGKVSPPILTVPPPSRGRIEEGVKPGDILASDEASEVKALAQKTPKSQFNVDDIIKNSLTRVQEEAAIKFDDPLIAARFSAAMSNRLKDIRDSAETKDLLTRAVNLGGVGLAVEAVDKIIKILDNEFNSVHEDLRAAKETEIRAVTQKRLEASEMKKVEVEKKEKDELESRFKKLFIRSEASREYQPRTKASALVRGKRELKREKKSSDIIEAEPSVASPERVKRVVEAKFLPRTQPEVSLPAAPPALSLEDVKYTPRLVGPLEELKNFSLDDLRKLSARPSDANRRLLDKLEVLRGEAMEKKIAGIGAFKASPLWQSYVEVINQALQDGKSPKDIIAARLAVDKGVITQDEFDAIMLLSSALRY